MRRKLRDPIDGIVLNPCRGYFDIVEPLPQTKNYIRNPSFEVDSSGLTTQHGLSTYTRENGDVPYGAWKLKIMAGAASDGVFTNYDIPLKAGTQYWFGMKIQGRPGHRYFVSFADAGMVSTLGNPGYYVGDNAWTMLYCSYRPKADVSVRVGVVRYSATGAWNQPYYTDGWILHDGAHPCEFFDGDFEGYIPGQTDFWWLGRPGLSESLKSGMTRRVGWRRPLDAYGLHVTHYSGLGTTGRTIHSEPYGQLDGAFFETVDLNPRMFTVMGRIYGREIAALNKVREQLMGVVSQDAVSPRQPLRMYYTPYAGKIKSGPSVGIDCVYASGLEGQITNPVEERIALQFEQHIPFLEPETRYSVSVGHVDGFGGDHDGAYRDLNHRIQPLPDLTGGAAHQYLGITYVDQSHVFLWGYFDTAGGIASPGIIEWNPLTGQFQSMGGGISGGSNSVYDVVYRKTDGLLYVVGTFTGMGGVAGTRAIAAWDIVNRQWISVGGGMAAGGVLYAAGIDTEQRVYVCGSGDMIGFGVMHGILRWDGNWEEFGQTPLGFNTVNARNLVEDPWGYMNIHAYGFDPDYRVYRRAKNTTGLSDWLVVYTGSVFIAGDPEGVHALAWNDRHFAFVGGNFDYVNNSAVKMIGRSTGWSMVPVGPGLDHPVYKLRYEPDVGMLVLGAFSEDENGRVLRGTGIVAGNTVVPGFLRLAPGGYSYREWMRDSKRSSLEMILFYQTSITGSRVSQLSLPLNKTFRARTLRVTSPGRLVICGEPLNAQHFYMDEDVVLQNEVLDVNLLDGSGVSSLRGKLPTVALPGSDDLSAVVWRNGDWIEVFVDDGNTTTTSAVMVFEELLDGI